MISKLFGEYDMTADIKGSMIVLTGTAPRAVCSLGHSCVQEMEEEFDSNKIILRAGSVNVITLG